MAPTNPILPYHEQKYQFCDCLDTRSSMAAANAGSDPPRWYAGGDGFSRRSQIEIGFHGTFVAVVEPSTI